MTLYSTQAGLGLRREMFDLQNVELPRSVDFWELAPENWMAHGGKYAEILRSCRDQAPLTTHGLSLSIGSYDELDTAFVSRVRAFLNKYQINVYSEHLSYCSADSHLYDLMPIPFSEAAVSHVVERVQRVQDMLQRPLVLENVSYYYHAHDELSEIEFIKNIVKRSGCKLLLDVNNVYVNSVNHGYDPYVFIDEMPKETVVYGHIAGHYDEREDLKIDTHGADVIEPVWQLLKYAYQVHGVFPTLLERDFNIPPLTELLQEVERIKTIQLDVLSEESNSRQILGTV